MGSPLKGIKVIDVTTNISGPSLTMILGDLGAEVIKVEKPKTGDDARSMGPLLEGEGAYYLQINRNKRSIVIDLKTDEGKDLLYKLIEEGDVFVQNFRFGVEEKLGLGYEKLKELNPRLIYCALTAYGQEGPSRNKPGYDAIVQADTGIMSINGPTGGEPARAAVSILDQGSAMWGAIGVLSAILHRKETGVGQKVETSLFETGVFWTNYHLLSYMATGQEPVKMGAGHAAFAPYGAFRTATQELMIGISNDNLFEKLCDALDREELKDDPKFKTNVDRVQNRDALTIEIEKVLIGKPADEWIKRIEAAGVPSSIIRNISEVVDHPQTTSNDMLKTVDHPLIDNLRLARIPVKLSGASTEIEKAPPLLGEDTYAILKESGLSQTTIDELVAKGIVEAQAQTAETR